jgi:hypothetical protein
MLRHSTGVEHALPISPDDELGHLIRWSLGSSFGEADPSEECWTSILRRVEKERNGRAKQRHDGPALQALTPLLQAVVISTLLLTFAAGLDRDVPLRRPEPERHTVSTSRRSATALDFQDDNLRGYVLQRMQREKAASPANNLPELAELP